MNTPEKLLLSLSVAGVLYGLQSFLLRLWRWFQKRNYPEGWVTAEEAEERRQRMTEKWAAIAGKQDGKLTEAQSSEAFSEILKAGEMGQVDYQGTKLTITMPLSIGPIDRCVQFEDPLRHALGNLGIIRGGGSFLAEGSKGMEIQEVDIGVVLKDLDRGLAVLRDVLKKQGAPQGTRIRQRDPVLKEYPLYE